MFATFAVLERKNDTSREANLNWPSRLANPKVVLWETRAKVL
jgi:hypothetical protein